MTPKQKEILNNAIGSLKQLIESEGCDLEETIDWLETDWHLIKKLTNPEIK